MAAAMVPETTVISTTPAEKEGIISKSFTSFFVVISFVAFLIFYISFNYFMVMTNSSLLTNFVQPTLWPFYYFLWVLWYLRHIVLYIRLIS